MVYDCSKRLYGQNFGNLQGGTVKARVECTECLKSDVLEGDVSPSGALYRAGVMCENVMDECGHGVEDLVVTIDGVWREAVSLPYFRESR